MLPSSYGHDDCDPFYPYAARQLVEQAPAHSYYRDSFYEDTMPRPPLTRMNLFSGASPQPNMEHDEDGEAAYLCVPTWKTLVFFVVFLIVVFFSALVIYALIAYNTDAVKSLCPELFGFMLSRTVLAGCVFVGIFTYNLFCSQDLITHGTKLILLILFLLYFLVLTVYGGVVVSRSMISNSACTDIIYDSTFQAPLLGDLGWVYVVCDGLYTIGTLLLMYLHCMSGYENQPAAYAAAPDSL